MDVLKQKLEAQINSDSQKLKIGRELCGAMLTDQKDEEYWKVAMYRHTSSYGIDGVTSLASAVIKSNDKQNPDRDKYSLAVADLASSVLLFCAKSQKGSDVEKVKNDIFGVNVGEVRSRLPNCLIGLEEKLLLHGPCSGDEKFCNQVLGLAKTRDKLRLLVSEDGKIVAKKISEITERIKSIFVDRYTGTNDPAIEEVCVESLTAINKVANKENLKSPDVVMAEAKKFLRLIESTVEPTDSQLVLASISVLNKMLVSPETPFEVKQEIKVRLAVHDTGVYFRKANGNIAPPKFGGDPLTPTLASAAGRSLARGREIDRSILERLFNDKVAGGGFSMAWDLLQKSGFDYTETVKNACDYFRKDRSFMDSMTDPRSLDLSVDDDPLLGKAGVFYMTDSNTERKSLVREYFVEMIARKGLEGEDVEASLKLAEDMILISGENSVMNRMAFKGNDGLSELIGFRKYREPRMKQQREAGAIATLNAFDTLATSWFRYVAKPGIDLKTPFMASDIVSQVGKFESGSCQFFYGTYLGDAQKLRDLVLDSTPNPKTYCDKSALTALVGAFDRIDPLVRPGDPRKGEDPNKKYPVKNLKYFFIAGLFEGALSANSTWTVDDFTKFRNVVSKETLGGSGSPFLEPRLFDLLWNYYNKYIIGNEIKKTALRSGLQTFLKGILG